MRILIANVNTTEAITEAIAEQARSVAAPGTEIVGLTPGSGPSRSRATSRATWPPLP